MAHPTRGHNSGTYELQEIVRVDADTLSLTYRHAASYKPQRLSLNVAPTPAAKQMLQAMADSIKIGTIGDRDSGWESSKTLLNGFYQAQGMVELLHGEGIDSFADSRIDVPLLRRLYNSFNGNTQRQACHLLARVVRDNHPQGSGIASALKNTRFAVEESASLIYDEETAAAIEKSARGVYTAGYMSQRDLFHRLGYDVSGRGWLAVPADKLIEWAHRTHPEACAEPDALRPKLGLRGDKLIAWALTHPMAFGRERREIPGTELSQIGAALYPGNQLLTAALILHCLGENSGYNQSVLLQKNTATLIYLGSNEALERNVKARASTQDTRATRVDSIYSPGGIVETLTGLIRFSRLHRDHLTNPDGTPATVVDRIYVEHTADPSKAEVLTPTRIVNAWRSPGFDRYWPDDAEDRGRGQSVRLWLSALRLEAQRRAMGEGLKADVHGHSERTKTHYLAHVLPDHVFDRAATAAQDELHDKNIGKFTLIADAKDGVPGELARVDAKQVMDVEIGLCTSGGNAPDGGEKRCALGIVACFTCPNGYRTVDNVPGLLAAVELANLIEANDPLEWEKGEASDLRYYSQECLDQFPPMVVANVRRSTDLVPHILTVTGMYMEMRHA